MVSIIVPVYNGEKYLERCISSLLNQNYENLEIIIVNDGSTDRTKDIIEHYSKRDIRLKGLCISNSGASVARNIGVSNAKGQYILFVDSDDYLEQNAIKLLVEKIENDKSDIVCMGHRKIYEERTEDFVYSWSDEKIYTSYFAIKQILKRNITGYICDKFFKKNIWNKCSLEFEKDKYCEDWPVVTKYIGNVEKVSFINKPLYQYVQHNESRIHTSNINVVQDFDYAVKTILSYEFTGQQKKENIIYFKAKGHLDILHELTKIACKDKINIYKLAKYYNLPSFELSVREIVICKSLPIYRKLVLLSWHFHIYGFLGKLLRG